MGRADDRLESLRRARRIIQREMRARPARYRRLAKKYSQKAKAHPESTHFKAMALYYSEGAKRAARHKRSR